ncbi:hypothetical protein P8452_54807 [Trifolium repens]|nr:hypothetical protein P8452_54807 [Trifolium repens]
MSFCRYSHDRVTFSILKPQRRNHHTIRKKLEESCYGRFMKESHMSKTMVVPNALKSLRRKERSYLELFITI